MSVSLAGQVHSQFCCEEDKSEALPLLSHGSNIQTVAIVPAPAWATSQLRLCMSFYLLHSDLDSDLVSWLCSDLTCPKGCAEWSPGCV